MDNNTFLSYYLRYKKISHDEFLQDIETLQKDAMIEKRIVCGMDIFPYLYVLHRERDSLDYFLLFFKVTLQKYCDIDIKDFSLQGVLNEFDKDIMVLYLIAAIQYYFL